MRFTSLFFTRMVLTTDMPSTAFFTLSVSMAAATTATSYVNTGAKAGTTYYYRIVAVKGTAASDFSNIVNARPGK